MMFVFLTRRMRSTLLGVRQGGHCIARTDGHGDDFTSLLLYVASVVRHLYASTDFSTTTTELVCFVVKPQLSHKHTQDTKTHHVFVCDLLLSFR